MEEEWTDYYALLDISPDASIQEINSKYRKISVKYHPDRNQDNPDASKLFHRLTTAKDILTDAKKRREYDEAHKAKKARRERVEKMETKRAFAKDDLERRENEFKKQKIDNEKSKLERSMNIERIKKDNEKRMMERTKQKVKDMKDAIKTLDTTEMTLKIKWDILYNHDENSIRMIFTRFGPIRDIVLLPKKRSGLLVFENTISAQTCLSASTFSPQLKQFKITRP